MRNNSWCLSLRPRLSTLKLASLLQSSCVKHTPTRFRYPDSHVLLSCESLFPSAYPSAVSSFPTKDASHPAPWPTLNCSRLLLHPYCCYNKVSLLITLHPCKRNMGGNIPSLSIPIPSRYNSLLTYASPFPHHVPARHPR